MKRLLEKFRNARLQVRLSFPVVTALVMLLVIQWFVYAFCADVSNDNLRSSTDSVVTSIRSHMDTKLRDIIERMYYMQLDASVQENLTDYLLREDSSTEAVTDSQLTASLSLYKAAEPMISSILLYTPKYTFSGSGMPMVNGFSFENTKVWQILQEQSGMLLFGPPMQDEMFLIRREVVPILHRFQISGYSEDCVLTVNLDLEKLTAYLLEALPKDGSQVLLVTHEEQTVVMSDSPASESIAENRELISTALSVDGTMDIELSGESYLVQTCSLEAAPWQVIFLQSKESYLTTLSNLRIIFMGITLLIIVLLLFALFRIVDTVTQPLGRLCEHIRCSENQHKLLDFQYPYQDEIGMLAQNYNSMATHIQHLLEEQERYIRLLEEEKARADIEQSLKRRAELRALQAQINPHFLYNTLDSIRWMAERAGEEDISRMTTALATLFRIALSRGEEIITVEQELRHVESYLMIQKIRYSDRMTYSLDVDPELGNLKTVKLILQPLVENAIYHGIKESTHAGNVAVIVRRIGDTLCLQVQDNGQGIPSERLSALQKDLAAGRSASREGYGIFNVNERIRLHFGEKYGLTLESEWGKGTTATVFLPCITKTEVEDALSYYGRG